MPVKKKISSAIGIIISLATFCLAFVIIHGKLKQYHYHEISQALHSIPVLNILGAIGLTLVGYLIMTFYDFMALRYVGAKIKYRHIATSSFISYSFSNNMGFPLITGAIRYRLYSAWELGAFEIAKVVAFCTFTLWFGFVFLTGLMFSIAPMPIPSGVHVPFTSLRLIGILFLIGVALYLAVLHRKQRDLHIRQWTFNLPKPVTGYAQLIVSSFDWILAAAVLFILLPAGHNMHFFSFLSLFLMAQFIGVVSQVPGGLGVFETAMLLLLGNAMPPATLLGVLLAFRVIYYLIPLSIATILFGLLELIRQKRHVLTAVKFYDKFLGPVAPQVFAVISFLGGLMLLFSGATPGLNHRLIALHELIPVPVMEVSHFAGSLLGIALLFLARGLQRRLNSAYYLSILAMLAGIMVSLLKGFDYEEAFTLALMLIALIPFKRQFYRHSRLIDQPFSLSWTISILIAIASTLWLGLFAHKHVQYSSELWWQFSLHGDASRFLRMMVGVTAFVFIYSILRLFKGSGAQQTTTADPEVISKIVGYADRAYCNLAFLGDKLFYVNKQQTAFIMYAIEGRSWVVMGDPIGKSEDFRELAWQFREYCDRHGGRVVFYEVDTEYLDIYLDMGLSLIKIGEAAKVNLVDYNLESRENKRRRQTIRQVEADGCSFEMVFPPESAAIIPQLQVISDSWQKEKNAKERGFSLGFFSPEYISRFPLGIVKKEGTIIAFVNLWTTEGKQELSLDLMRYLHGTESSVMEYLFIQLFLWGKANGYQTFDLGMAPLSGLQNRTLAPLWHRLGSLIFLYGNPIYRLQGLRQYKEKFKPTWHPMYIASAGGLALPETLLNLISLISGGYKKNT
jgi:phosphatidylglycerol lysyltransferase